MECHTFTYSSYAEPPGDCECVDLNQSGDGRISRRPKEGFKWRKISTNYDRLYNELPENLAFVPLDQVKYHSCCDKKKTEVKEWQADHLTGLRPQAAFIVGP